MDLRSKDAIESSKQHDIDMSNILIAEFMGVNPTILGDEITYEMYGAIDCIEDGVDEQHFFLEEQLLFHTSWDWLMPVVQKCFDTQQPSEGQHYFINESLLTMDIDVVYDRVVEFIKIYNDDNNK